MNLFCENLNDCIFSQKDTLTNMIGNLVFDLTALLFDVYFQTRKTQELIKFAKDMYIKGQSFSTKSAESTEKMEISNFDFKFFFWKTV